MIDQDQFGPPNGWNADPKTTELLDAQRAALQSVLSSFPREPQVGDVWLSAAQWTSGAEEAMSAMLVVLRSFNETWSSRPLFDVAPVSEDERLASEWSLMFGSSESGLGLPVVLHIDAQCTTTTSMLARRVGALSDMARLDVETLMHAYALGDDGIVELQVGRRGSVSIRFHPEWDEFSRELAALCQAFAVPLALERKHREEASFSTDVVANDERVLAVASGERIHLGPAHCNWEYLPITPFVHRLDPDAGSAPMRLGEAIATYYATCHDRGNVASAAPQTLDRNMFFHLTPFLDVATERLIEAAQPGKVKLLLFEMVGEKPSLEEMSVIVASLRCARVATVRGAKPMRLAARRDNAE